MTQSLLTRIKRNANARTSNANATLHLIHEALDTYSGDWTNIAWLIALSEGADKARVSAIIEAASGMRFRADAKQPSGLRLDKKSTESNTNRMELLKEYADSGVSFRSKSLENDDVLPALLEGAASPKLRTVEEIILAAVRKARKDNPEQATDPRIITALQAALAAD